ncbi:MAG: glycine oxidase ThiO [Deltaproteobacteria bacterium]|nr:MAG: glycine oxidase ThiO [Deltaproteobacteria bacterium]
MHSHDVVVVGGGVIGCSVAFALSRMGASVVVVERDRVGAHASRAAAGMLAPITESPDEGAGFQLGLESLDLFPSLIAEIRELSGIDPRYLESGLLRVGEADEVEPLRARAARLEAHGCRWLDGQEVREREPRLAPAIEGGLWSPREGHVDGFLLTRAYAGAAARRGARFQLGTTVSGLLWDKKRVCGVRTSAGEIAAADVVLCQGAWTGLAEEWGPLHLPIQPVKGQMISLEAPQPELPCVIWGAGTYLVPRDDSLRVGATVEHAGFDVRTTAAGIAALLAGATRVMPSLADCTFREAWAGLRPGTPDDLPLIGPLPGVSGLTLAAGHYRRGVLLSPLTGLAVADWILSGKLPAGLAACDPARFQKSG